MNLGVVPPVVSRLGCWCVVLFSSEAHKRPGASVYMEG